MTLVCLLAAAASTWRFQPRSFTLHNRETARKYYPASVPGGIAVFDYDNDGNLDLHQDESCPLAARRSRNIAMFSFAIEDQCNSTMSQKKRASRALSTLSEHLSLTTGRQFRIFGRKSGLRTSVRTVYHHAVS